MPGRAEEPSPASVEPASADSGHAAVAPAPEADWFAMAAAARQRPKTIAVLVQTLKRAVALVWAADRRLLLVTAALQVAGSVLLIAQLTLVKVTFDRLMDVDESEAARGAMVLAVFLLAGATAASSVIALVLSLKQRLLEGLTLRHVWLGILDVSGSVDLATFERPGFFDHLQRIRISAVARPLLVTQGLLELAGGVLGTLGVTAALLAVQPLLVPALFLAGLPLFLTARRTSYLEFDFVARQTPSHRARDYLAQVLSGREEAKEVRAFGLTGVLREDYEQNYEGYLRDLRRHLGQRQRLGVISTLSSTALTGLTVALLLGLFLTRRITLAEAGTALIAVRVLAGRVSMLFGGVGRIFESGLFLEDFHNFLSLRPTSAPDGPPGLETTSFERLSVEDVSFRYPGAHRDVLSHVSLQVDRGQVIAIVGENGSGKTTLAKLLAGLYVPTAGRICWDGVNVEALDAVAMRRHIAVIFQDFVRYQLTAQRNIGLGRPEAADDRAGVRAAAAQAGALTLIDELPRGFETILSKEYADGVDLSLGQWQRVALARAFYRDAPFVILDEPSASLDARAEHQLFESIRTLLTDRTVLVISHRFSTVRSADHIFVLRDGRIVEDGRHEDLMAAEGTYAELFNLQAAGYQDTAVPEASSAV